MALSWVCTNMITLTILWTIGGTLGQDVSLPTFITQPTDTEVLSGEEGGLNCTFDDIATNCYWSRNEQEVQISGRYSYVSDPGSGNDCSIRIKESDFIKDNGAWACGIKQTSDTSGHKSGNAHFTVLVAPKDPILKVNGNQLPNGGDIDLPTNTTTVECMSEGGYPAAILKWKLSNSQDELQQNTSISFTADNLTIVTSLLTSPAPTDGSWRDKQLTCEATHKGYKQPHTVNGTIRIPSAAPSGSQKCTGPMILILANFLFNIMAIKVRSLIC